MSVVKTTGPNVGRPAALPCSTVTVEPGLASVCDPCDPEPTMTLFAVSDAALVTQVGQAIVPVVVMVPPVSGELMVRLVTVPEPGGADQVLSPRRKVADDAPVPLAILAMGMFPVISVARLTAPNVGSPAALPWSRVVVVPRDASTLVACPPPPTTSALSVRAAAFVVQVGHESVPVVVIGPPDRGAVVEIRLTLPVPPGTFHVPSPAQKVVGPAEVPELR